MFIEDYSILKCFLKPVNHLIQVRTVGGADFTCYEKTGTCFVAQFMGWKMNGKEGNFNNRVVFCFRNNEATLAVDSSV